VRNDCSLIRFFAIFAVTAMQLTVAINMLFSFFHVVRFNRLNCTSFLIFLANKYAYSRNTEIRAIQLHTDEIFIKSNRPQFKAKLSVDRTGI